MARVLAISSWVAAGHVGLSAIAPALNRIGCEIIQIPSITLSNHRGWTHAAGAPVPPHEMEAMAEAVDANGWLTGLDAVLTGYLPSAEHAATAARIISLCQKRSPSLGVIVDPVLGDNPKGLYVPIAVAEAIANHLVAEARVLTPNLFELSWLTGHDVSTPQAAIAAARSLIERGDGQRVLVTSPPVESGMTGVLEVMRQRATLYRTPRIEAAPNGPGDVFAGLIAAGLETGRAVAAIAAILSASAGKPHLRLTDPENDWTTAPPVLGETL